jgi:uncharacterized membrane protein
VQQRIASEPWQKQRSAYLRCMREPARSSAASDGVASVLRRNIEALREARRVIERQSTWQERLAGAITDFTGSMNFVLLHLALFGGWILINTGITGIPAFDPFPFVMLAMIASVEAIFLSTFVLISQNRMAAMNDRREELNVQVTLLAEHEITRLLQMTEAIAGHLGATLPAEDLAELKHDVQPDVVMAEIEASDQRARRVPDEPRSLTVNPRTVK